MRIRVVHTRFEDTLQAMSFLLGKVVDRPDTTNSIVEIRGGTEEDIEMLWNANISGVEDVEMLWHANISGVCLPDKEA